jgi:hypothetical protein
LFPFLYFPSLHIRLYVALAVGVSFGIVENATIPAILWLRTARELVPVQHCSKKTWGKFSASSHVSLGVSSAVVVFVVALVAVFFVANPDDNVKEPSSCSGSGIPVSPWRVRTGRKQEYQLLNLESESVDLFNPDAQRVYGSTQERMKFSWPWSLAEWHEQLCESGTSS